MRLGQENCIEVATEEVICGRLIPLGYISKEEREPVPCFCGAVEKRLSLRTFAPALQPLALVPSLCLRVPTRPLPTTGHPTLGLCAVVVSPKCSCSGITSMSRLPFLTSSGSWIRHLVTLRLVRVSAPWVS